ncbi:uncharacterized protein TNCV_760471 [Trichonephila clavipes]|nr:uncharacterized protein TNCV_760471 [Trichonephila clavipes]
MSSVREDRTNLERAVIEQLMEENGRWMLIELERASGIEKRTSTGYCAVRYTYAKSQRDIEEIWARAYEPELKRQSAVWGHAESPRRQEIRQYPSSVKLMVIVAYDVKGHFGCHFVLHGKTLTAQYCMDFLVQQIRRDVRDKHPDLVDSAIILYDNATPHKSECVWQLL